MAEDWNTSMKFKSKYESSEVCFWFSDSHNLQPRTEKRKTHTHKLSLVCSECHKICCLLYFNLSLPLPFILLFPLLPPTPPPSPVVLMRAPLSSPLRYQVWLTAILLLRLFCHLSCSAMPAGWLHSTTAGGDNNLHWSDPSAHPAVTNGNRLSCGSTIDCPALVCVCVCVWVCGKG